MTDSNPKCTEVSIFGGGVGECIVIKLEENVWMIVDSCRDPKSKKPMAIKYFEEQGINYKNCVKYIMATHWHDDHIKGMADLVEKCPLAKIVVSIALHKDEFYSLVSSNENHDLVLKGKTSGIREFYKIFNFLKSNNFKERLIWAKCNQTIYKNTNVEISSLSPSDKEITLAMERIALFLPEIKKSLRTIPYKKRESNHTAIVTFVKIADLKLLLGADLEESSDPACGWRAIISNSIHLEKGIKLIKVPHHGSQNAHSETIWEDYLLKDGVAIMTPFSRSGLPKNDDIDRITHFLKESYCTSSPQTKRIKNQNKTVAKTIKESTKSYRLFKESMGQVKFEYDFEKRQFHIETYGAARRLISFKS